MTQPVIGAIGTGRIGNPLALSLLRAGYTVLVCDAREQALTNLLESGAHRMESPGALAQASEIVFLSLPTVEVVQSVLFGEAGVCAAPLKGMIIVDTSTLMPTHAQAFAQRISQRGGAYLDAPVTGGEYGAATGTLSIMVGGSQDAFRAVEPILQVIGDTITYMGASGAGQAAKLVSQSIMAGYFVAIAEGFSLAEQFGLDVEQCFAAIADHGARSELLSAFGRAYFQPPSGDQLPDTDHYAELFLKDIHYALQEGHQYRAYMPVTALAYEIAKQMLSRAPRWAHFPLRLLDVWNTERR